MLGVGNYRLSCGCDDRRRLTLTVPSLVVTSRFRGIDAYRGLRRAKRRSCGAGWLDVRPSPLLRHEAVFRHVLSGDDVVCSRKRGRQSI